LDTPFPTGDCNIAAMKSTTLEKQQYKVKYGLKNNDPYEKCHAERVNEYWTEFEWQQNNKDIKLKKSTD